METGTIVKIKDVFGFIEPDGGRKDIFFHQSDLVGLDFDDRLIERRVKFEVFEVARGLRARAVRAAD